MRVAAVHGEGPVADGEDVWAALSSADTGEVKAAVSLGAVVALQVGGTVEVVVVVLHATIVVKAGLSGSVYVGVDVNSVEVEEQETVVSMVVQTTTPTDDSGSSVAVGSPPSPVHDEPPPFG